MVTTVANDPSKDIQDMLKKLTKAKDELQDKLLEVGEEAVTLIRKRTRLGYGVSEQGGKKKRLKKLDEGNTKKPYTKRRKNISLSSLTTPAKSNLTQSGAMLDDLEATKTSNGNIEIGFSTELSEDKATWNTDKGRPFNNLSKSEQRQLKDMLTEKLEKILKKLS